MATSKAADKFSGTMRERRELATARKVLERHYAHILNGRRITGEEIRQEMASLKRKEAKGTLDDSGERLYSAIFK